MNNLLKNLKTATSDVMEQMYFLLRDTDDDDTVLETPVEVFIGITGAPRYLITLGYDRALASSMAADLLGLETGEFDSAMVQKNLNETANVIAGKFLLLFDDAGDRNLTIPSAAREDIFGRCETAVSDTLSLSFEGRGVTLRLEQVKEA